MRLLALALLVAACRETPADLADCNGDVAGVWRDQHGRRYHLWDERKAIEVFPMWDTSVLDGGVKTAPPILSPLRIRLERTEGHVSQRVDGCVVKRRAALGACRGRSAVLDLETGPLACGAPPSGSIRLELHRE